MTHPEFRSVLLAEFYKGSNESEQLWWSWKNSLLAMNHSSKNVWIYVDSKHQQTLHNVATPSTLIYISFSLLVFPRCEWEPGQKKKKQCSLASRMIEWHFYDVSQIIRWDGWAELDGLSWNTNWLIHRMVECAVAVPLLSCSFFWTEHSDRHAGKDD